MRHLLFAGGVSLSALLLALLEVQIEGPNGWGAKLPTWRRDDRVTRLIMGGKPLTGYHLYLLLFVATMAHLPFFLGFAAFGWPAESRVLAFIIFFWVLEDFLWFCVNPAFGIRRFRREHIWWHEANWLWFMPRDYWIFPPIAAGLYWVGA